MNEKIEKTSVPLKISYLLHKMNKLLMYQAQSYMV